MEFESSLMKLKLLPVSIYRLLLLLMVFSSILSQVIAQDLSPAFLKGNDNDIYGVRKRFIENKGQYGDTYVSLPSMGTIKYAYEGFDVPVLFTSKGIIYLHRKVKGPTLEEKEIEERKRKKKKKEEEIEELNIITKAVSVEWVDANSNVEVIAESPTSEYHTYGFRPEKARAYKTITYRNIYNNIDVVYRFREDNIAGYEYIVVVKPGGDLSSVKMRYGGDVRRIRKDTNGNLILKTSAGYTHESYPVSFYAGNLNEEDRTRPVITRFKLNGSMVNFDIPDGYDKTKTLIIDPFVTGTTNLTGTGNNAGIAKDVDFDYAGNVYVTGGGNGSVYKLAKYDSAGVLQWTFSGALTIPAWTFGSYYGGWVVDKNNGSVYLGQGFAPGGGHRVIRINTIGVYDNYITNANASFLENWKMYWSCNGGTPRILIAGGGTNSNINFGIISPPSTTISSLNVTGIPYGVNGWAQDISDVIIDPLNNDLYTIYGSLYGTPSLSNQIYKNPLPYSGATVAWNTPSGYNTIMEIANRPYLTGPEIDNSSNVFAINSDYLFFWDGKNLKAFDKASGATVGTPVTIALNTPLMAGGIIADECNNIYVGSGNGTIKVYYFNGTTFDDGLRADILIPGFSTSSVYDLAYYEAEKILYASGNGFVASFDVSTYNCAPNLFTINVNSSCGTLSAVASLSPAAPAGSTVTYVLYNGTTQIAVNTTGVFTGLSPNITYEIKATVNTVCSGAVSTTTFSLPGPTVTAGVTHTTCGNNDGIISVTATNGLSPYTYSINGINFQAGAIFTSLAAGIYNVTAKDVNGCGNTMQVTIINSNGPAVTATSTNALCGSNTGTVTAASSGGVAPVTYSINGSVFQTNNFFTGILPGNYTLTAKDDSGCVNVTSFTVSNIPGPTITAVPSATYCNTSNGSIVAVAFGLATPFTYSINGNIYQGSNTFNLLSAGSYTVYVKDTNGCVSSSAATIANVAPPTVTATITAAICSNANGSITANGTGGTAPYSYSINGINFQSANFFFGLVGGTYLLTIKDANGCTNTTTVNITSSNSPQIVTSATTSICSANTGTITAIGSGGTGVLQYSINGINYQASGLFSGLAANTYTVTVRDAAGCISGSFAIVANTSAPVLATTVTPTSCSAYTGVISVSGTNGLAPYEFSLNAAPYQSGNIYNGLSTGTYTVAIKDANGCTSSASVTLSNVAGLTVTGSMSSSSCTGNTGSVTATGAGGIAPLQYSLNGTVYQSSNLFAGLSAGTYTLYVKDAGGCVQTTLVTVIASSAPTVTATVFNANCSSNNGVITANGSGGVAPLQYSINGTIYQTSKYFINLAPGSYTIYVRDAANCIQTTTATITTSGSGAPITTFTVKADGVYACNGDLGKITNPKVNGGTCGTCTYSLNGAPFVPNQTQLYTNLNVGIYIVTAMNTSGCTKTINADIIEPPIATATAVVTPSPCNQSIGSITLTGIGPNTPYHSSIDGLFGTYFDYDPSMTFSNLAPGTYEITNADDASFDAGNPGGCTTTLIVIVPSIGGPSLTTTKNHGTCKLNDGFIDATGTGGVAPLEYRINGGAFQSSGFFSNLASGIYIVDVQDADGCITSRIDTIQNPSGPSISAITTPTSCGSINGAITANASGGTPPLQYSINGTVFQSANVFSSLAAGIYTVYVGDLEGCISKTNVSITNIIKPTVSAFTIAANCNINNGGISANGLNGTLPYQFSIDSITFQSSNIFTSLGAGFYDVYIKDANGCINKTAVSVPNIAAPQLLLASTAATCLNPNGTITATGSGGIAPLQYSLDGVNFQTSNLFSGLAAGAYSVDVKDAAGCVTSKAVLINSPNVPQSLTATVTNASCSNSNGSIIAAATGGVAPLQYSINGVSYQVSASFTLLPAASYPLTVKDANGCTITKNIVVKDLAAPIAKVTATQSSCFANDGTITVQTIGGTAPITYSKNGITFQVSSIFTGLAPGAYIITAKDFKGCIDTAHITVAKVVGPTISAAVTPLVCGGNITINQTGGLSPYLYNLNASPFQVLNQFPCQLPGNYLLTVMDANNCTDTMSLIINSTLPVELLSFNGIAEDHYNLLEWTTASERDNDYFIVEKQKGNTFEEIAKVDGSGNSSIVRYYSAKDMHPDNMNYYRLKQVDFNGQFEYSKTIVIRSSGNASFNYSYNGIADELIVVCASCNEELKKLEITDASGRIVYESPLHSNKITVSTTGMAGGIYIMSLTSESKSEKTRLLLY